MANKSGTFCGKVVDTDKFYKLSKDAKLLYYEIGMRAENKGIVRNIKSIAIMDNIDPSCIQELIEEEYIVPYYEDDISGVYRIVHWYENNAKGENSKARLNYSYRKWRKAVLDRDKKCALCGSTDLLEAHHLKPYAEYPLLRTELNNGITLCHLCHTKLHGLEAKNG